jgi:hypothetical protein
LRGSVLIMSGTINKYVALLIPLLLIAACISIDDPDRETAFNNVFPLEDTNNSIRLFVPLNIKYYKLGTDVDLIIENLSDEIIVFPPNYDVRIFRYSEGEKQWIEVEDIIESPSEPLIGLAPHGSDDPYSSIVVFHPKLKNLGSPIPIRVTVTGKVGRYDVITDEQVGAYIDIVLYP